MVNDSEDEEVAGPAEESDSSKDCEEGPIDFFFLMVWGSNKPHKIPNFVLKLRDCLKEGLHEAQHQMTTEAE